MEGVAGVSVPVVDSSVAGTDEDDALSCFLGVFLGDAVNSYPDLAA